MGKNLILKLLYLLTKIIPRKTWSIINELTSNNQKSSYIDEIKFDYNSIHDLVNIAHTFNEYFSWKILLLILWKLIPEQFFFHLSNLSKSKETSLDRISSKLLRKCSDLISESLTLIFNRSINTGIFPNEWKYGKVIPFHKHGNRNCTDNYRPISIIPVVVKAFETIYNQLLSFLKTVC